MVRPALEADLQCIADEGDLIKKIDSIRSRISNRFSNDPFTSEGKAALGEVVRLTRKNLDARLLLGHHLVTMEEPRQVRIP